MPLLVLLLLCAAAVRYAMHVPAPLPSDAPLAEFSAMRAMDHVKMLSRAPRLPGSEQHRQAQLYIMARIASLGLEPRLQDATGVGTRYPVAGRVRNIVARMPGTFPGRRAVLLVAHYDGVAAAPAAGDDASGVAVLLETLRAIRSGTPLRHDVIALFADGEEAGLLGAAAFVREHPWARDAEVILNFEARGTGGPSLMFETGQGNHDVVRTLRRAGGARATSLSTAVYRRLPNDTDLSELAALGRPAMNFAFIGGVQRYHTSQDDTLHLSPRSVQHHGNQALALTRAFANGPLPRPTTGDAVFFDLPLLGLVTYPESWALPLAVTAILLVIVAAALRRRAGVAVLRDAPIGMLAAILATALALAAGAVVALLVRRAHAALPWGGSPEWSGLYAAAITLLGVAIAVSLFTVARRAASAAGLALGAAVLVTLLALFLSVVMPGVSYLLTWPALVAAAGTALSAWWARPEAAVATRWTTTVVVVAFLAPTLYLMVAVALGVNEVGGAVLGALSALGACLLTDHLTAPLPAVPGPARWRPALLLAASAVLLAGVGLFTVRTTARSPAGASLVYAVDADSGTAWMGGGGSTAWVRGWIEREMAARREGGANIPPLWLTRSMSPRRIAPAPAPTEPLDPPSVTVLHDSTDGTGRHLTMQVRGGRGSHSVQMTAAPGAVLAAAVDGRPVDRSRYRAAAPRWSLEYVMPTDSGFTLALSYRAGASAALTLVARHAGARASVPALFPARPDGVLPIQLGDVTLVHRHVVLSPGR